MGYPTIRRERTIGILPNFTGAVWKRTGCILSSGGIWTHTVRSPECKIKMVGRRETSAAILTSYIPTVLCGCLDDKKRACRRVSLRFGCVSVRTLSPHTTSGTMCEGLWAVFAPAMPPEPTNRRASRRSQRYSATSSAVYRHTQVIRKGMCHIANSCREDHHSEHRHPDGTSSQQDEPQDYPMRDATRPESGRILFYDRNEPYYE